MCAHACVHVNHYKDEHGESTLRKPLEVWVSPGDPRPQPSPARAPAPAPRAGGDAAPRGEAFEPKR